MKKFLIQSYLWLSVLLLGGHAQSFASQDILLQDTLKNAAEQEFESFHSASFENYAVLINYATLHFEKQNDKIESFDNEEEEEELSISKLPFYKKYVELNKQFSTSYYANTPELSYQSLKKSVPPSGLFLHFTPQRRYIMFRVIRI
ncbi:hypothetical protein AAEO56_15255 [Flavobacterium sp. DGU11]|uniref:Uncharacterized protein n=1 Tax=Flavobacterium arundinis TaxID=3139143 RepID=A0ABU9HZN4_9FLAO